MQVQASAIADMLFEIESDLRARRPITDEDPRYGAYLCARLELESLKPDFGYAYNVLASALCRPLATRH